MKKSFYFICCVFLALTEFCFSQTTKAPERLIVPGYQVVFMPRLLDTPTEGPDYQWSILHIYMRESDHKIGFCRQDLVIVTQPIFTDVYMTVPSAGYPLLAVKGENGKWGFFCIAISTPANLGSRCCGDLVYNCVFDQIAHETFEKPFENGSARVQYNGQWITINIFDDIVNKAHGINENLTGFIHMRYELLKQRGLIPDDKPKPQKGEVVDKVEVDLKSIKL